MDCLNHEGERPLLMYECCMYLLILHQKSFKIINTKSPQQHHR